ncbi:MAG: hypothetical protein IJ064_06520 [Bacteroidaceae bacterium]|nr:hypothetical protein [Bacteroidaceae bacterium]
MKNRLSKLSRKAYFMLLLLAVSGISTSCKDEYTLDDEKPTWLSSSIYDKLQGYGNFSYYIKLLSDPDVQPRNARSFTDVLSRTGSKTVFAANDEAWEEFFKKNALRAETDPWHNATSYENLTLNQKKLLIHTSMLNNAIVMENLSASTSDISSRGDFMRRYTDVELTDSITYVDGNSLPTNYNVGNEEKDYWARFRKENGGNGVYLVTDASSSMMVHFTNEHMVKWNVTDDDFAKFMGTPRTTSDVHIYDAKLLEKDQVAENGYINITEKVMAPLPNMAEAIRTNGQTYIFSHMLDRWSAPFYNDEVTKAYEDLMQARGITWTDSIFSKRYFSENSYNHLTLANDPDGQLFKDARSTKVLLKFDPGWNAYVGDDDRWNRSRTTAPQYDMAAMYVPNDEALRKYFSEGGGGWNLIKTFYLNEGTPEEIPYQAPTNNEELFRQIDQIPISVLNSLINVIMFKSFVGSVPSKMTDQTDDANEQLFYPEDVDHIKQTVLANNGMVYIMDKVYGPADYTSVAAPAYITNTNKVMNWAIYNGSEKGKTDYMGLNYYAYLKAMQSRFVLFLPSDEGMQYYYDPVSFPSTKSRMLNLTYRNASFPISYRVYSYNAGTGTLGASYSAENMTSSEIVNRLKDILESHTIVLDGVDEIDSGKDEYYVTKNGSGVKVSREDGKVVKVQGGFQIENEERGIEGTISDANRGAYTELRGLQNNNVTDEQNMANGTTYILDSPIIPASRSVYSRLSNDGKFDSDTYNAFCDLCMVDEAVIRGCGLVDELNLTSEEEETEVKKYSVFHNGSSTVRKKPSLTPDYYIQFFNNYRYTIFIPTDDAIATAVSKGLPTWEEIRADYKDMETVVHELDSLRTVVEKNEQDGETPKTEDLSRINELFPIAQADSLLLKTKVTYLINFVRYHFVDNSVFVDKSTLPAADYVTASYDNTKGLFCKVNMQRPSSDMLQVKDDNGGDWLTVSGKYNVMARDLTCSKTPTNETTMNGITIDGSSFAVIHQLPGVLNHTELVNGRYDSAWSSVSNAKKYLKRFAIH